MPHRPQAAQRCGAPEVGSETRTRRQATPSSVVGVDLEASVMDRLRTVAGRQRMGTPSARSLNSGGRGFRMDGEGKHTLRVGGGLAGTRRERTSEVAPEAVRQAVGGGCQSGLGAVTVGYKCH
eukprot:CAMPEP_0174319502 /NCGR_PEP_ID=MMETSP0810-20121108/8908_1 /TAXON_ID=73025 ORGANISM="Eutreptiella gymnastica-like, Strain CCMP1594" /NCGR_SAMPLE_ID=MMETSP0810 /ASSEMBLY_ACC=CAM_ASM_000659 /LENGTH=122 /DNA_ID=CAMNT_0015430067 /DNA_START=1313 /DNA_END=1681 /DNA_ORIENTATION=+